ncbi:hypothetical protein OsI_29829 [Oryza sativa Indica Group]|uniref:Uncharacterized protein n=1 Tax=Oryza sativa subsp. indica TaxID=39946 RepID=B8BCB5_ORYSI|nr:hypothetical protein OsI_29829 [Oryza sativa Indica Group]
MEQILESSSPHQDSTLALSPLQLEAAPSPRDSPISPQDGMEDSCYGKNLKQPPSPTQEIRTEVSKIKSRMLIGDVLESIDQDLPADVKASLDPVSQLDNYYAAVKQALKNQSAQPALEQRRAIAKKSVKDLHSRTQSNKELLAGLQSALESKETRKAELEVELKNVSAEIEADKKKIAEIPGLREELRKEASAALNEEKQLKAKLSALAKTQEADKQLLENISNMILNAKNDTVPAPLARAIVYNIAGPISILGHLSPSLAQIMSRPASLDAILAAPPAAKRKTSSLTTPSAIKKKRTSSKRIAQAKSQQLAISTEPVDASVIVSEQILMDPILESSSSHQEPALASPDVSQPEASSPPKDFPSSPQHDIQESLPELELPSLSVQEIRNEEKITSSPSYSFPLDDLVAEQVEEISSNRALSEETQAKLKEIFSFLHKDIQDQVKDADLLRDMLEPIEQNLPVDIQASLEPISQLDQQFAAVRQVLKSQSLQPALEQRRAIAKQSLKDLYIQAQSNKELSARLQLALDLKKTRKAELEAELRTLSTEIEADEKKLAELPDLTEKIRKEASAF